MEQTENMKIFRGIIEEHKLLMLKISNVDCEGNRANSLVFLKNKTKYVYVDIGQKDNKYHSGLYMIDKDQSVFSIKGYGQKGYFRGTVDTVITKMKEDIENMKQGLIRREETGTYGHLALNY